MTEQVQVDVDVLAGQVLGEDTEMPVGDAGGPSDQPDEGDEASNPDLEQA